MKILLVLPKCKNALFFLLVNTLTSFILCSYLVIALPTIVTAIVIASIAIMIIGSAITIERAIKKGSKELMETIKKRSRAITIQEVVKKS